MRDIENKDSIYSVYVMRKDIGRKVSVVYPPRNFTILYRYLHTSNISLPILTNTYT